MIKIDISRCAVVIALFLATAAFVWIPEARGESGQYLPAGATEKVKYYDNGKIMSHSKFTRGGVMVEKSYYYPDGGLEKTERYDEAGEKIEESNYGNDGNLSDGIAGWAAKRWVYKDGQLRSESTYGSDGHLTERKIYNDEGDLVARQYVGDGNIDPYEEFNRGSVVTKETDHFYNENGRETGSETTAVDDLDDMPYYP